MATSRRLWRHITLLKIAVTRRLEVAIYICLITSLPEGHIVRLDSYALLLLHLLTLYRLYLLLRHSSKGE